MRKKAAVERTGKKKKKRRARRRQTDLLCGSEAERGTVKESSGDTKERGEAGEETGTDCTHPLTRLTGINQMRQNHKRKRTVRTSQTTT